MNYWSSLDTLVSTHRLVIDRPKGSRDSRYSDFVYPMDYGYLGARSLGTGPALTYGWGA
jgi:inorganic pyrophosphatase